jgi:hypothetical protein
MKLNWGFWITVVIIAFMGFILMMVFKATQEKIELVSETYYAEEMDYDRELKARQNAQAFEANLEFAQEGDLLKLVLPQELLDKSPEVHIHWYLAHDATGDFKETLGKVEDSVVWMKMDKLRKGNKYEATILLEDGVSSYQFERIIYPS